MNKKNRITIITQNINKRVSDDNFYKYREQIELADIYAFQEFKRQSNIVEFKTIYDTKRYEVVSIGNKRMKKLWEKEFCWIDFKSGYWKELEIEVNGVYIYIVNVHISCRYSFVIQYLFLKRLSELQGKFVILLGDFNAALYHQTENAIDESHRFLSLIKEKGYVECLDKEETDDKPHYTFRDRNGLWKKLDHIFISSNLETKMVNKEVEYIDKINMNKDNFDKQSEIYSDHSGIRFTFEI